MQHINLKAEVADDGTEVAVMCKTDTAVVTVAWFSLNMVGDIRMGQERQCEMWEPR